MIDSLIAFRVLYMLVTPFKETEAFKLGIIDEQGKRLKNLADLKTQKEKDAYNMLVRLVFNLKRLLAQLPGGDNRLKSFAAAYFLVRENINNESITDEELDDSFQRLIESDVTLVEETIDIKNFLALFEDAPVNSTGPAVSSDEPVIRGRKFKRLEKRPSIIEPKENEVIFIEDEGVLLHEHNAYTVRY